MNLGILLSIVTEEQKLLFEAAHRRGFSLERIDDRKLIFDVSQNRCEYDAILERNINHSRALYSLKILNDHGVKTVNTFEVAKVCGSKFLTTMALLKHKVPTLKSCVAFTAKAALEAIEEMGYPVVLKPAIGSWGRLIARVNDRASAEAVLEHKETLGSYHHSVFYIQEYVDKKHKRDIRSFVIEGETICAIYRYSDHWKTNTALGGRAENCPVDGDVGILSAAAAEAVGGGIVAVDLIETEDRGIRVNEVNYTMEFRNSIKPTGVDIPNLIIDYLVKVAQS